jgi:hypothetical protein
VNKSDPTGLATERNPVDKQFSNAQHFDTADKHQGTLAELQGTRDFHNPATNYTTNIRRDENNISSQDIGHAVVADARNAAELTDDNKQSGHGVRSGQERAFGENVNGHSRERTKVFLGNTYNNGHETIIPISDGVFPLTDSHSHPPGSGPGFEGRDVPSAKGVDGKPYISSVGWYQNRGVMVNIFVPGNGGGSFFHSRDGVTFLNGLAPR